MESNKTDKGCESCKGCDVTNNLTNKDCKKETTGGLIYTLWQPKYIPAEGEWKMKREIKFRVFDKQDKSFHFMLPLEHHFKWSRFEVSQYTGLKDKNGKDIYEGDIVNTGGYKNLIVTYWNSVGGYVLVDDTSKINHAGYGNIKKFGELEVIGNIYENSSLLGKGE